MNIFKTLATVIITGLLAGWTAQVYSATGDNVFETCPSAEEVGKHVACYPLTFTARTLVHPEGIPLIAYLFVPTDAVAEPLPVIVFAHGSGSIYSSGEHNKGLNEKHLQWVRQYTEERDYVTLHVSSFHSRYMLPDTEGDQRILDWRHLPDGPVGGDDYRATSTVIGLFPEDDNPAPDYVNHPFNPELAGFNDQNGGAGVSEIIERPYDMMAAWDFLAGLRPGEMVNPSQRRNDGDGPGTLATPLAETGYINEMTNVVVDHERIFLIGTSHGGQTAMAAAHDLLALDPDGPMNHDLPDGMDGRRFAAFFDFYGGCGLFGAFGGDNEGKSTWRPYAPFIKLAGEYDSTVFDGALPIDTRAKLEAEGCHHRIAAAKADPDFHEYLEMVVYDDAYHSFDGVQRDDVKGTDEVAKGNFNDWLAKVHADYRIVVPFMDAISRQVSAARNNEDIPSLAELGFSDKLSIFDTIPLAPHLGPQLIPGSAFHAGEPVAIDNLASFQVDLAEQLHDPFDFFAMTCELIDAPASISETDECDMEFTVGESGTTPLPAGFWIEAMTDHGRILIPARVERIEEGPSGRLTFMQEYYTLPIDSAVSSKYVNEQVNVANDGLVWTRFRDAGVHAFKIGPFSLGGYQFSATDRILSGPIPSSSASPAYNAFINGNLIQTALEISDAGDGSAEITLVTAVPTSIGNSDFLTDSLPVTNFLTNFVALDPVGGDENPGDDEPGDDEPGDDEPGDDEPDDTGPENPDKGSGGGGALFWLLPFALLFRRR